MSNFSTCDEHTIVLFQQGEKTAFTDLYSHYVPAILGILTRIIADQNKAEECLNRSFFKIWSDRLSYDPVKEQLFTWMVKIALSCCACSPFAHTDNFDRYIREKINLVCGTDIESYLHQKQRLGGDGFATSLDPAIRKAIDLVYFKSYSYAIAADKSGISVDDLKRMIIRTIRQLKQIDTYLVSKSLI